MKIKSIFNIFLIILIIISNIPIILNISPVHAGSSIFVSVTGNDTTGDGSIGNPYKTIHRGLNATSAGDTLYIRAGYYKGVYYWTGSGGTAGNWITITNYNGENVVVDRNDDYLGGGPAGWTGQFFFQKQHYILIDGLKFYNATKIAIMLEEGASTQYVHNITVQNCHFENTTDGAIHTDPYGSRTIKDIIFRNNTLYNNNNGWYQACGQEAISMDQAERFQVYNNTINLNWKICIDAKASSKDGIIYNNYINTSHPNINPYYYTGPENFYWNGGGITIDGASTYVDNINIFNNTIYGNKTGITISTEVGGVSSNISVYNNIINLTGNTDWCGIILWHKSGVAGQYKDNISIFFNTIYVNGRCIYINEWADHITNLIIANNILDTNQNTIGIDWVNITTKYTITNNLFNVSSSDTWGVNSINGSPMFVSPNMDFYISSDSPAKDAGSNSYMLSYDFDGTSRPQNLIVDIGAFEYLDITPPSSVRILFAGNPSDFGGPYYQPPYESGGASYRADNGYYTNNSKQTEDYIFINVSAVDDESAVSDVWVNWLNETTWINYTYGFVNVAGNYWNFNSYGNISVGSGYNYSFDVVANSSGGSTLYPWNKTDMGGGSIRRFVQLDTTPSLDLEYIPLYLYISETTVLDDILTSDRRVHDQGVDGSRTDVGYLKTDINTDIVQERHCGQFLLYYVDVDECIIPFGISTMYVHAWWTNNLGWTHLGQFNTRGTPSSISVYDEFVATDTNSRSMIEYDQGYAWVNDTYKLGTGLVQNINIAKTENNIYEFQFKDSCELSGNQSPSIISNRSMMSFVIFNIPDNQTLMSLDNDSDGLTDYQELWVTYTNPFVSDTDNDGVNDYDEVDSGTDPNNYTDYTPPPPPVWSNTPPTISSVSPANNSEDVSLYPSLSVYVGDVDGNQSTVYWYYNDSGSWYLLQTNNSVLNQTVTVSSLLNASDNYTVYDWRVIADDTHNTTNKTFYFTTMEVIIRRTTGLDHPTGFYLYPDIGEDWNDDINESVSDDDAGYIFNGDGGFDSIELEYDNIPDDTNISFVTFGVRCRVDNVNNYGSYVIPYVDGHGTGVTKQYVNHTNYRYHYFTFYVTPDTGDPWTVSDINDNTVWLFGYSKSASYELRITQFFFLIGTNGTIDIVYPPSSFSAVSVSNSEIDLSWVIGLNATNAYIRSKINSYPTSITDGNLVYNGTGVSYSNTGLNMGTAYYYKAWGYNSTSNKFSDIQSQTSMITWPGNISNLAVTDNYTFSISLSWTKGINATRTVIRYSSVGYPATPTSGMAGYNGTGSSTTISGLSPSTKYYFSVWAYKISYFSEGYKTINDSTTSYGDLTIWVYKETQPWVEIRNYTVFITNEDGSQTYENTSCNNPHNINISGEGLPVGENIIIQISKDGYHPRSKYLDIYADHTYNESFYLPPDIEGGGTPGEPDYVPPEDSEDGVNESYANLYVIRVIDINELTVENVKVTVKRYINTTGEYEVLSSLFTDAYGEISVHLIPQIWHLVILEKDGYITKSERWKPDPIQYGIYYPKIFKLLESSVEPIDYVFSDICDLRMAWILGNESIRVTFVSYNGNVSTANFSLYEQFNGSLFFNQSWEFTNDNEIIFYFEDANTSRMHMINLNMTHSVLGSVYNERRFLAPLRDYVIDVNWIENKIRQAMGSFELGWVNTFLLYGGMMFVLLALCSIKQPGLGVMGAGAYGFLITSITNTDLTAKLGILVTVLFILGFLILVIKYRRKIG